MGIAFASSLAASLGAENRDAPSQVLSAQIQATVYEVNTTAGQVAALDGKALAAKAFNAEELLGVLTNLGEAKILYRMDQPVNLLGDQIQIGSSEPVVSAVNMSATGRAVKNVTYMHVGFIVRLSAEPAQAEAKRNNPDVKLAVQLAVLAPTGVELAPGVPATTVRSISAQHVEALQFDLPQVIVNIYSPTAESQAAPTAYVIRYLFKQPASK